MIPKESFYSWKLICYGSEEDIKLFVKSFKKYAYIKHDKCLDEEGKLKKEHWHVIGSFEHAKSISSLKHLLNNGQNVLGERMIDKIADYEYLYHKNDPDKYQYKESDIVTNDKNYFYKDSSDKEQENENFYNDLISNKPLSYMAKKYGRDFMRNYTRYKDFYYDAKQEIQELERRKERENQQPKKLEEMEQIDIDDLDY